MKFLLRNLLLILTLTLFSSNAFAAKIVSSIKPIDSLVRMIVGDKIGNPIELGLIVEGNASPHGFDLKPSQIKMIKEADLIFYIDDSFESFAVSALSSSNAKRVSLLRNSDVRLFTFRNEENWQSVKADLKSVNIDSHIWLDTKNAKAMLKTIKDELSLIDPTNAATYEENYEKSFEKISDLFKELEDKLQNLKGRNFMVFHDGFHYFEEQFGLSNIGAITANPHLNISIKSLKRNKVKINNTDVKCIFYEPQFDKRFVYMVAKGTKAKTLSIDPIGFDIEPSADLYIELMRKAGDSYVECLSS